MKKLFVLAVLVFICLFSTQAMATDTVNELVFSWEQLDPTNVHHWNLYWSDTTGVYTKPPFIVIPHDPTDISNTYTYEKVINLVIPQGEYLVKYFVLTAANENDAVESGFSNEVSKVFFAPMGKPFNLKLTVIVQ